MDQHLDDADEWAYVDEHADEAEHELPVSTRRRVSHWIVAMVVLLAYAIGFLLIATWLVYRFGDGARELLRNLGTTDG